MGILHEAVTRSAISPDRHATYFPWSRSVAVTTTGIDKSSILTARNDFCKKCLNRSILKKQERGKVISAKSLKDKPEKRSKISSGE